MPLSDLSDEQLLEEFRKSTAGRRDELVQELFGRHYQRVARWCYRFTGDREAAADLAQDVFLRAHRYLASFRGTSRFSTWLYSIARNESISRLDRRAPDQEDDSVLADIASLEPGPDERAEQNDRRTRVKALLSATLDQQEQTVFTLHYGDGVSLDAITRLLALDNPSGAKAYIVSARRKLARAVDRMRARGEYT